MDSPTVVKIKEIVEPILDSLGLELVELQLRNEQIGLVLRVIIYKETGVSHDDCSAVSREVGHLLEIEDLISNAYHLEVSSPGLDRPLSTERDFTRNLGKKITLTIRVGEEIQVVTGRIKSCHDDVLELKVDSQKQSFSLGDIAKAKLVIEF